MVPDKCLLKTVGNGLQFLQCDGIEALYGQNAVLQTLHGNGRNKGRGVACQPLIGVGDSQGGRTLLLESAPAQCGRQEEGQFFHTPIVLRLRFRRSAVC